MTVRGEHLELWREELDTNAELVWDGIQEEIAPPLRKPFRSAVNIRPWRWAAAAAVVALLVSGLWNAVLLQELENVRTDYVIAMLKNDSPLSQLTTLDTLRSDHLSANLTEALQRLVISSQDPNIQLAALDILLEQGTLSDEKQVQLMLPQVRYNQQFIEMAVRARFGPI